MGPLDNLLRPRSVAIIGASADAAKLAGRPLLYLEKYGFHGDIWPVNPRYEAIGGHRCYPEIAALPQPPDVAMVLVGMSRVTEAVRQLAAIGTETAIVLASGFGESGWPVFGWFTSPRSLSLMTPPSCEIRAKNAANR